jgi:hypothetical protein
MPYGCNVNVNGIGNINGPENNNVTNYLTLSNLSIATMEGEIPIVEK